MQLETGSSFVKCAVIISLRQMENPGRQTSELLDYFELHNETMQLPESVRDPVTTELVCNLTDGLTMCMHERKSSMKSF